MPSRTEDNIEPRVQLIRKQIESTFGLDVGTDAQLQTIYSFIENAGESILFGFMENGFLKLTNELPKHSSGLVVYFLKKENSADLFRGTVDSERALEGLSKLLSGNWATAVQPSPPPRKDDQPLTLGIMETLQSRSETFLAALSELSHRAQGRTVLYVPPVPPQRTDREAIPRWEALLSQWSRQLREALQLDSHVGDEEGPLGEVSLWQRRAEDLAGLEAQVTSPAVRQVVTVLSALPSAYVAPFLQLTEGIHQGAQEAAQTVKHLSVLLPPCEKLATAHPRDIPAILPNLLQAIHSIWNQSPHHRSPEKITGLLRKVSTEIILRCRAAISLPDIFNGFVERASQVLQESIESGEAWKKLYQANVDAESKEGKEKGWNFERTSIFAQSDAFVQRCRDLLEICEAQQLFARMSHGKKSDPPIFGGTRGPEISKSLLDIEVTFEKLLKQLNGLDYDILDVKVTRWHDDYTAFKRGVKDIDALTRSVVTAAFEGITTEAAGWTLLRTFEPLGRREAIKRILDRKRTDLAALRRVELNAVKRHFDGSQNHPPRYPLHPPLAGKVEWLRTLQRRTQPPPHSFSFDVPDSVEAEVSEEIDHVTQALTEAERQTAKATEELSGGNSSTSLLSRFPDGSLAVQCDPRLTQREAERVYWERWHVPLPEGPKGLREMRERVRLLVRRYNHVRRSIREEKRGGGESLFADRLSALEEQVREGWESLTWDSPTVEEFLSRSLEAAAAATVMVRNFQRNLDSIHSACVTLGELVLVSLRKKKVYKVDDFKSRQQSHQQKMRDRLEELYQEIAGWMNECYEIFQNDSEEVQIQWRLFVEKIDSLVQTSLKQTVKKSLQELSKAILGDGKVDPHPLFHVDVLLESNRVQLKPGVEELAQLVNQISKDLVVIISAVPRLRETLESCKEEGQTPQKSFYELISNDEEILRIFSLISSGMVDHIDSLQKYTSYWDKYKHLWDLDKEAFFRRYAKANRSLETFEADINEKQESEKQVEREETLTSLKFLQLDCGPLKYALLGHCTTWIQKFTHLLRSNALAELASLHEGFTEAQKQLKMVPRNLEMLDRSISFLARLEQEAPATEARFLPLQKQFQVLERLEVPVDPDSATLLAVLPQAWNGILQSRKEAAEVIAAKKEHFQHNLSQAVEDFGRVVAALMEEYQNNTPSAVTNTPEQAASVIAHYRGQLTALLDKEAKLKQGLQIFHLEPPIYKELTQLAKELEVIEQMWKLREEWEILWEGWKRVPFRDLNIAELEDQVTKFLKRVVQLARLAPPLPVGMALRSEIEKRRSTLPLLQALSNSALRPRHWNLLQSEVGKSFDPLSSAFTVEQLFALGLEAHGEYISALSVSASKELAIEESLRSIEEQWKGVQLDLVPHKESGLYRIKGGDEIFQLLEDQQVTLSTMKASRFYYAFEVQVEHWERTLSHILETTEMLLQVQRGWRYLENIFSGFEDIRRQLPAESSIFDKVNFHWKSIMDGLKEDPNALRGTHKEGLLDLLTDMNTKLEKIQKSLDQYLETKRTAFPRFYFLSNDDLLEILGQSKEPLAVQNHLSKCFDNLKKLEFAKDGRKRFEAIGMHSGEGEYVPFFERVIAEGPVETWLALVEGSMRTTLKRELIKAMVGFRKFKKDKWINETPGQLTLASSQIGWTAETTKALHEIEGGDRSALKELAKKQRGTLKRLSDMIKGPLSPLNRLKLVALLTMEIHSRDVIDRLIKSNCSAESDFDWQRQLRFYWEKEEDDFIIRQWHSQFTYGYEYLGNTGRLVVTPLTERCYLTLTTALYLKRGGSPQGPAGTGKTETVKDLGKSLGKYVLVFNCSESLDYRSLGRSFSGLAQTGAWSCFDEFNRIEAEVLSVVAQQISTILAAIAEDKRRFVFDGAEIRLNPSCGLFITMNPEYAGRTELPDNLKSLFRPIAMMVPDSAQIAEIMLYAEGFGSAKFLAKKIVTLYDLAAQQLSKQDHYDFTLRAIKAVLITAGALKRHDPDLPEDLVLLRALRDTNLPKFVTEDIQLFLGILSDLFPGADPPEVFHGALQVAIEEELVAQHLQPHPFLISKILQLYDTKLSRHGVILVGATGTGKSTCWRTLQGALARLHRSGGGLGPSVGGPRVMIINPKAVGTEGLYGGYHPISRDWQEGSLAALMRTACADDRPEEKWIVLDGPVDTLWIESMNSLLDDNKVLTLANSERIYLTPQVSLIFEVADLKAASPATVSRCGMIYLSESALGWEPFVGSWLAQKGDVKEILQRLIDKWIPPLLAWRAEKAVELFPCSSLNLLTSLCNLFDALATPENGVSPSDSDFYERMVELWFIFSIIWSVGASVDDDSRKGFDAFVRDLEGQIPQKDTVYEYYVDPQRKGWSLWEEKIPVGWKAAPGTPFYKILVPTVDTLRYSFVMNAVLKTGKHLLLTGNTGTGKTSLIEHLLSQQGEGVSTLTINFSAQTSSERVQGMIEERMEKRTKDVYVPVGGKKLLTFIDDMNMPRKDAYGSQPPLELLRQWIDYHFWYDRGKPTPKLIKDVQLICAMGPPGGGRSDIPPRLQSRFHLLHLPFPQESQIKRIYGTLLHQKLFDFEEDVKALTDVLTQATLDVFNAVSTYLLPTPSKSHYIFNLRDMSKVFEGMLQILPDSYDSQDSLIKLWVHESFRVFSDRLVDEADRQWFRNLMVDTLASLFGVSWQKLYKSSTSPSLFGNFMGNGGYQELPAIDEVRTYMAGALDEYNVETGNVHLDLVLFRDAIEHVTRILRIIQQPRGNALLIGLGGSGRQSLSRLAAHIAHYKVFQIEIRKNFRESDLRERLKDLFYMAGLEDKPTMFLFTDTQIKNETFLEDISFILSRGELPHLFTAEEIASIRETMRQQFSSSTPTDYYALFLERAWANIHCVICLSPVGTALRDRLRMFPSLVNCTTIDWFSDWPESALREVALKFLEGVELGNVDTTQVADFCVSAHTSASEMAAKMAYELKREYAVTPTNYMEFIKGYLQLLHSQRASLRGQAEKLSNGLIKLEDTRVKVEEMSVGLEETKRVVARMQKECEEYLMVMVQRRQEANEQAKVVAAKSEKIGQEEQDVKAIAAQAQADLDRALPALEEAKKSLASLNKKDLAEVKAYSNPPPLVEKVLAAVMVLRKADTSWAEAKRQLNEPTFLSELINYPIEKMSDAMLKKVERYCMDPEFRPEKVEKVSHASMSLCMWVRAMEKYGHVYREVAPKQQAVREAAQALQGKTAALTAAKSQLKEVDEQVAALKSEYAALVSKKETLRCEAEDTALKLQRAEQLVSGLATEKERWERSISQAQAQALHLPADCLVAAAFRAYGGPFPPAYRSHVTHAWLLRLRSAALPASGELDLLGLLASPVTLREWNLQGLPTDRFSQENGALVVNAPLWPLLIDPQGQGTQWIKRMEKNNGLQVITLTQPHFMRTLENAMRFGTPVLLQDIGEELDPALDPILNKAIIQVGGRTMLKLEEGKEVEYNPDFRFYIASKHKNPQFRPEVSTKTTIVNFNVTEQSLEAQLLASTVRHERQELEEQKDELVLKISRGKRRLVELEDEILHLLNTAQGSLLEDEQLVNALQSSKETGEEIKQQLAIAEQTEAKIDHARQAFAPVAVRAATLFFVLNDLSVVDPMYQFSLQSYSELFLQSLQKSPPSDDLQERIKQLNDFHTTAVYRTTCRGLFEKHKLLFAFQICVRIMESERRLNKEEYRFFLRGGQVLNKESQMPNPCPDWLPESAWDNLTVLDHLPNLRNIAASFEQNLRDWKEWYFQPEPEAVPLPGEWENKCSELQHLLLVRSFRPDRILSAVTAFISNHLDPKYVEPPPFDLAATFEASTPFTPLVFVLSPGVDPRSTIKKLAEERGMGSRLRSLALGQGQAGAASRLIEEGLRDGQWIFLANCHLMLSWLDSLEQLIEDFPNKKPHPNFRLWLSSNPHPKFPTAVLQRSIKITTEPPKGLKQNLQRLYNLLPESTWTATHPPQYKRLLFAVSFFHSLLLERSKFLTLGWNRSYDFNDSDFQAAENLLSRSLDPSNPPPWAALRFLIGELTYGGRVTDPWDRRLLEVYTSHLLGPDTLTPLFRLSPSPLYVIPPDGPLATYKDYLATLPSQDRPEVFGQHPNADIASLIQDANSLLTNLLALQPRQGGGAGESREEKILLMCSDLLKRLPSAILLPPEGLPEGPVETVVEQEVRRYNSLLSEMRKSLQELERGVKGLTVMTKELDEMFHALDHARVPPQWGEWYPSVKGLAPWIHDLLLRLDQLRLWAGGEVGGSVWLGGLTFPTALLTAHLQRAAREWNVPIDSLGWDCSPVPPGSPPPTEGLHVTGLWLEGARWDSSRGCLVDPLPMELFSPVSTFHFKPVDLKKKQPKEKEMYICPCYLYPIRTGSRERPSFMVAVELNPGDQTPDYWIRRGTALLLSLP